MIFRLFGWSVLAVLAAYLLNNYLTYWQGMPGPEAYVSGDPLAVLQAGLYVVAIALAAGYVQTHRDTPLRVDSRRISDINAFIIRAAFWTVLTVGLADMVISFLRVEGLLEGLVGHQIAGDLGRSQWRGPYVHMPLIAFSIVLAIFTRTLGFPWLALLVVAAELMIVLFRFIFSYEQAFMADLVRFWYAALFLFASAYTLKEEGHVRVDVFYTNFSPRTKGYVNAIGSVVFGIALCWVILVVGMGGKSNIINSPLLSFETTQAGFGLYVKYLMAGFLAVFAVSMMIQFVSYFLDAVADIRGEPGGRDHNVHAIQ
ncbi:TRAP transporter small permease subunit [Breoghania corrubedonensis]|nr:TRAP transporter small permease subunit [Breoghania corrubedonensis]